VAGAVTYENGRLPDAALVTIPGGGGLLKPVAADWVALCDEVERLFGWRPEPSGVHDSYRPYSVQESTFLDRYTTTYTVKQNGPTKKTKVWNGVTYYLRKNKATAAVPGKSNHGWACAVDVTGLGGFAGVRYLQFATVAARFGWTNTEGRSINEPWHWVDVGTANLVSKGLLDLGALPDGTHVVTDLPAPITPLDTEDDEMKIVTSTAGRFLIGPLGHTSLNDYELATAMMFWGPDAGRLISDSPADRVASALELVARVSVPRGISSSVWAATVQRGGDLVTVKQELADAKSLLLGQKPASVVVDVDEAALAAAITARLGALSDADVQRIAKASADEASRRLAS